MQISKNDPTEYQICDLCVFEISNPNFTSSNDLFVGNRIGQEQLNYENAIELENKKVVEKIKKEQISR